MFGDLSRSDSDSDSDQEEECRRFFSVCAENKINALLAKMRQFDENYERPEAFENEAVSMAIQQHGLRNYVRHCCTEIKENHCNQNLLEDSSEATTSKATSSDIIGECNGEEEVCSKSKQRKQCSSSESEDLSSKQSVNADSYEIDDDEFLNEAVAVAIKKKGLSSSSCNALE